MSGSNELQHIQEELDIQSRIIDLMIEDEEFTLAAQQINEHAEYIHRRLSALEDEKLRESIEDNILECIHIPKGRSPQDIRGVLLMITREAEMVQYYAYKMEDELKESVKSYGVGAAVFSPMLVPLALAPPVGFAIATVALYSLTAGTIGATLEMKRPYGSASGDFKRAKEQSRKGIKEMQDFARSLGQARDEMDRLLSLNDQEIPEA